MEARRCARNLVQTVQPQEFVRPFIAHHHCHLTTSINFIRLITFPYPETYFCTPPNEDLTNEPLCRPLPTSRFPAPPVIAAPVVRPAPPGSSGWVTQKSVPVQKARFRGASGRGAPAALRIPALSRGAAKSASVVSSSRGASSPWGQRGPVSAVPVSLNISTKGNPCKVTFTFTLACC